MCIYVRRDRHHHVIFIIIRYSCFSSFSFRFFVFFSSSSSSFRSLSLSLCLYVRACAGVCVRNISSVCCSLSTSIKIPFRLPHPQFCPQPPCTGCGASQDSPQTCPSTRGHSPQERWQPSF